MRGRTCPGVPGRAGCPRSPVQPGCRPGPDEGLPPLRSPGPAPRRPLTSWAVRARQRAGPKLWRSRIPRDRPPARPVGPAHRRERCRQVPAMARCGRPLLPGPQRPSRRRLPAVRVDLAGPAAGRRRSEGRGGVAPHGAAVWPPSGARVLGACPDSAAAPADGHGGARSGRLPGAGSTGFPAPGFSHFAGGAEPVAAEYGPASGPSRESLPGERCHWAALYQVPSGSVIGWARPWMSTLFAFLLQRHERTT